MILKIGALTIEVQSNGVEREEPDVLGDLERASDGTQRSTIQGFKHTWRCQTPPLTATAAAALETEIGLGAKTVEGDLLKGTGTAFSAIVLVTGRRGVKDATQATDLSWILSLRIIEV